MKVNEMTKAYQPSTSTIEARQLAIEIKAMLRSRLADMSNTSSSSDSLRRAVEYTTQTLDLFLGRIEVLEDQFQRLSHLTEELLETGKSSVKTND